MFRNTLVGGPNAEQSEAPPDSKFYGEGDEVLPSTDSREVIRSMSIENRGEKWVFNLRLDITNKTADRYHLELTEVVLQDGTVVTTSATKTIAPDDQGKFVVDLSLPEGTIPRELRMEVGGETKNSGSVTRNIPLASVPVRKLSK